MTGHTTRSRVVESEDQSSGGRSAPRLEDSAQAVGMAANAGRSARRQTTCTLQRGCQCEACVAGRRRDASLHATPDRAAKFDRISEGLNRQRLEDLDAIQAILDDAYHDHTEQSDRTVAALTRHMAQRIYLWCQARYE